MSSNMTGNFLAWIRQPFGIGVVALVLFGGAVVFGLNATHGMPLVERKTVKVAFSDLSGLNTGDDVRIAGARVGYVDEIKLEDDQAVAVLKIDDPDTELYQTAEAARVTDRSGLGQKFINLDPGDPSTGALRAGDTIPVSQTTRTENLSGLLDVFDEKTREATSVSLGNLGGGMLGHGDGLQDLVSNSPGILDDTATVSNAFAADGGVPLENMLTSADRLSSRLAGRHEELAALIDETATTIDGFAADDGRQVDASLEKAPATLTTAKSALDSLNGPLGDTAVAMRTLRPGASALGQATPDLRAFLREGTGPLQKVPAVSEKAVPGVGSLTDVFVDLRPLSRQLVKTGDASAPLASVLGRFAWDIANFHTGAAGSLAQGDSAGHWLRILLLPGEESVAGTSSTVNRDPYPEPTRP